MEVGHQYAEEAVCCLVVAMGALLAVRGQRAWIPRGLGHCHDVQDNHVVCDVTRVCSKQLAVLFPGIPGLCAASVQLASVSAWLMDMNVRLTVSLIAWRG